MQDDRREIERGGGGGAAHVKGKKMSPASVTLPFVCYLLPPLSPLSFLSVSLSPSPSIPALCPWNVPTREGEEEERRGRVELAFQTGERREKERKTCGRKTEKADGEVDD